MAFLQLQNSVAVMRKELHNLRKQVEQLKHMLKSEIQSVKRSVEGGEEQKLSNTESAGASSKNQPPILSSLCEAAIGTVRTCFREKNGTPRQPGLVRGARGVIRVERFTNPAHSLEGLEDYSHAWLLFVFHLNEQKRVKAKVKPPRMGGEKRGVFATRSPHRPVPVGLSLVKIDQIVNDTLYISGVDLVDGTPVLDIKPYIPAYDNPTLQESERSSEGCQGQSEDSSVRVAPWLGSPRTSYIEVELTKEAEHQLSLFQCHSNFSSDTNKKSLTEKSIREPKSEDKKSSHVLEMFHSVSEAREAIVAVLQQDPRSVYRREKCSQELYKFSIDNLNITCEFTERKAKVVDIQPKEQWTYRHSASGGDSVKKVSTDVSSK